MKNLFLFLTLLVLSVNSYSQEKFTISGKVTDESGKPLPGASLYFKEANKQANSDFEGNYNIKLEKGTYTVVWSCCFTPIVKKIILSKNMVLNFSLGEKVEKLDEVLVKAVRVKATAPVTHSNLSKKEIAKRNLGQDIPVLLNYLPSVISSSDAGAGVGYTYLRVRGSDASRVNVTINGIAYNDAESQGTFWVNLGDFASSTQSLQLQRGVGTSTNGSAAFGASLNILTDAVSEKAYGEISNSFGSFDTRKHSVKFSTGMLNEHFEINGRISNIFSNGYIDRAFADLKSYFLQASYIDDNTLIKALTFGGKEKTYQAWNGISAQQLVENRRQNPLTYDNETDNYWQNHYQLHWNERLNDNWSTNIGLNYTKGRGYFEQFRKNKNATDFGGVVVATNGTKTDAIVRRWLDNDFYVVNANITYKNDKLEIISGASYNNYTGDHFGEVIWAQQFAPNKNIRDRYYFSDAKKTDFSVFSKATYQINEKWTTFLDLQGRFVNYNTKGLTSGRVPINIDSDFSFFNPKVGVTYNLSSNNSFYFSYARANREPNRRDFESNAANVKHETLNDFELGWRLNTKTINLNTNIYYMQYNNQLVLTGAIDNVGEYLRENVKDSYRLGLEVDANILISDKLKLSSNFALSTNKINGLKTLRDGAIKDFGTTNIAFSPNFITGNSLTFSPVENLQLSLLGKYVSSQYMSNTDTQGSKIDGYFVSVFNVIYEINTNKIFKSIVLSGLVNNLFNKEYVNRGYTYLDSWSTPGTSIEVPGYYPQATTNFLAGVTLKF